jgi:multidrug efflux pump subunit AcrB
MLGRGGGEKIEAAFRGPDPAVLRGLAEQAKGVMASDPEALAILDDCREKVPVVRPEVDPVAAERAGVDATQIAVALNRAFTGTQVGVHREDDALVPIVSRAPLAERLSADQLDNVKVYNPIAERYLPVGRLVRGVEVEWVNAMIRRVDRFPTIQAQPDPPPGDLPGPLLERLRPGIEAIALSPGYAMEWEGEYKASREANEGLALSAPYGFAAMVLAVVVMFNALRQPLVIWLTVPLAIIGVTIGLLLFRVPFEFMAILGSLSLIGMLGKNSIVLVDQADAERRDGKAGLDAVLDASVSRARPVFLGALTTILGVAPLPSAVLLRIQRPRGRYGQPLPCRSRRQGADMPRAMRPLVAFLSHRRPVPGCRPLRHQGTGQRQPPVTLGRGAALGFFTGATAAVALPWKRGRPGTGRHAGERDHARRQQHPAIGQQLVERLTTGAATIRGHGS